MILLPQKILIDLLFSSQTSYFPAYGVVAGLMTHMLITCLFGQVIQYAVRINKQFP